MTVLAVGPIDFHHRNACATQVTGEPGAIGASAFDPDQGHGSERAQPIEQLAVARCVCRELFDTEQPADVIECRHNMNIEVGINPARDRARLYDGHRHPFSEQMVKGWHALAGRATLVCRASCSGSARQPARPVGAVSSGPVDGSFERQPNGVSPFASQTGTRGA